MVAVVSSVTLFDLVVAAVASVMATVLTIVFAATEEAATAP